MGQIQDFFKQTVFAECPDEPGCDQRWLFLLLLIPTGIIIWFATWFLINTSATEDISDTNACCDETEVTGGTLGSATTCNIAEDSSIINTIQITGGQIIETECDTTCNVAKEDNTLITGGKIIETECDTTCNVAEEDTTLITGGKIIETECDTTCNVAEEDTTLITGGQIIGTECDTNGFQAMSANSDLCAADDNTNSVQAEITPIIIDTVINTDGNVVNSDCCAIDKAADDNTKEELAQVDTDEFSNSTEENVVNSAPEKTEVVNHTGGTTIVRRARTLGRGRARK